MFGGEMVYSVTDYWDGIIEGFANYSGAPHHFRAVWNPAEEVYTDTFVLTSISEKILQLAVEVDSIFRTWRAEFDSGRTSTETHPGIHGNNVRFVELQQQIKNYLDEADNRVEMKGRFLPNVPPGAKTIFEVVWTEPK